MRNRFNYFDFSFILFLAYFIYIIFAQRQDPAFDQNFVLKGMSPLAAGWPRFDSGITSNLIVDGLGLLGHFSPSALNSSVRAVAGGFLLLTVYGFLRQNVRSGWLRVLGVALLISSGFPFLWLSSEVFAAAFLMLLLHLYVGSDSNPYVMGFVAVLASLCKPDLVFMVAGISTLIIVDLPKPAEKKKFISALAAGFFLLNIPGVLQNGLAAHLFANRGFDSLSQHFANLASRFQIQRPAPEPWTHAAGYMTVLMPKASSVGEAIRQYFELYFIFVSVSLGQVVLLFAKYISVFFVAWAGLVYLKINGRLVGSPRPLQKGLAFVAVSLIGLLPIICLTLPHVRYLARFYVLFLALSLVAVDTLPSKSALKRGALAVLIVTIFLQISARDSWRALTHPGQYRSYWFPD